MILESIVSSVDRQRRVNLAPMGPTVDPAVAQQAEGASLVLRPFDSSRTCRNLIETRKAVVHVTDDSALLARAAVDALGPEEVAGLVQQLDDSDWWVLRDCHRWMAVEVESISSRQPRLDIRCRVVRSGIVRPFFGFNRAKHAVVEAAIVATRTDRLPADQIRGQIESLQPLIDKTGGPAEQSAFDFLRKTIDERLASQ